MDLKFLSIKLIMPGHVFGLAWSTPPWSSRDLKLVSELSEYYIFLLSSHILLYLDVISNPPDNVGMLDVDFCVALGYSAHFFAAIQLYFYPTNSTWIQKSIPPSSCVVHVSFWKVEINKKHDKTRLKFRRKNWRTLMCLPGLMTKKEHNCYSWFGLLWFRMKICWCLRNLLATRVLWFVNYVYNNVLRYFVS